MTSGIPPTACLSDFGFTTMALDSCDSMPTHMVVEGGTFPFKAPELLVPGVYGLKDARPTREADIFAFGLVVLQVRAVFVVAYNN